MARLVKATCPQCGAGVHIDASAEVVTCAYCGMSSFVERPNRPVTQAQPGYGTIRVDAEPASSPGCAIAGMLGFVALAFVAVTIFTCVKKGGASGSFMPTGERVHFGDLIGKVTVADPKHADVTDLLKQARAALSKTRPTAKLTGGTFFEVRGGTIDLDGGQGDIHHHGSFNFDYAERDPSKPPGKDVTAGTVMVALYYDEIHAVDTAMPPVVADVHLGIADPKCTSQGAWAAAVKSGVPSNAVAQLSLQAGVALGNFVPNMPNVPELAEVQAAKWQFTVEGHLDYTRTVDVTTCAIQK